MNVLEDLRARIEDVVGPTHHHDVAVLVFQGHVAGEVAAGYPVPVLGIAVRVP